jgi:hypothetical protein
MDCDKNILAVQETIMKASEWIMVVAVVLAPLIALQINMYLERKRREAERKSWIFKTLMATRASTLSPEHVQALNMIDIEFYGRNKRSRDVVEAWKAYLDHLNDRSLTMEIWNAKRIDLFVDLLYKMALCLNYRFDRTSIKRTSYFPEGHGEIEEDLSKIRKGLATLLAGETPLPMRIISEEPSEQQIKMQQLTEDYLSGKTPTKVIIVEQEKTYIDTGEKPVLPSKRV